jgi:hypothetical protein
MYWTGRARSRNYSSFRRIPFAFVAFIVACAPVTAGAREGGWHIEVGLDVRRIYGLGNLSELTQDAGGVGGDIHIVKSTGGLGVRLEGGTSGPGGPTAVIMKTTIFGDPTPRLVGFDNAVNWGAVGPTWCFPLRRGRAEVYVLGGAANTVRSVHERDSSPYWTTTWVYGLPSGGQSSPTPILIAGSSWSGGRSRIWGVGNGAVWDEPPILLEGGSYLGRTRQVTMSSISVRLGTNLLGWSRER